MITFNTLATECSECEALLELDGSLKVADRVASISPFGTITEDSEEGPDLVLDTAEVDIICAKCQKEISDLFEIVRED